jgi:hypothetical protein
MSAIRAAAKQDRHTMSERSKASVWYLLGEFCARRDANKWAKRIIEIHRRTTATGTLSAE